MTTWADHCADILSHPADDGPRLVAADWLEEFGTTQEQHERAEFIRLQIHMANCRMCHRKDGTARKDGYTANCGRCVPGRVRESELLSAVSPETCPLCATGKDFMGFCGHSNAVRWAGKLGGHDQIMATSGGSWHVAWGCSTTTPFVHGRFVRGFIGAVSLSCASLVGERCETCEGTGRHLERRASHMSSAALEIGAESEQTGYTCQFCHGSGRVGGLRSELRQHPLGECVLSDKRPECSEVSHPHWMKEFDGRIDEPCVLPECLFSRLENGKAFRDMGELTQIDYPSAAAASAAASAACCRWIRG